MLPFSAGEYMGVDGAMQIIGLEDRDAAYSAAQNGGGLIESPREIRELSVMLHRIGAKAASEEAPPRDHQAVYGELRMIVKWRKSSYTGGANDNQCVELGRLDPEAGIGVRDSKDPDGGYLVLSAAQFASVIKQLKQLKQAQPP
ncbi:DUF397 domain-containing protein [Actinomadura coerulea]|uniref:DUF397 domain-containing protein n=1 Tax=Actinomadura coerulea TaxID=46159 RepID=UPI0034221671